jgi:hypothetical protein
MAAPNQKHATRLAARVVSMMAAGYSVPMEVQSAAIDVARSGSASEFQYARLSSFLREASRKTAGRHAASAIRGLSGAYQSVSQIWQDLDMLSLARAQGQSTAGTQARIALELERVLEKLVRTKLARNIAGSIAQAIGENAGAARMFIKSLAGALRLGGFVGAAAVGLWQFGQDVFRGAGVTRQTLGSMAEQVRTYRGDIARADELRRAALAAARAGRPISTFWAGAARRIGAESLADYLEEGAARTAQQDLERVLKAREMGQDVMAFTGVNPNRALAAKAKALRKNIADLTPRERGEALEDLVDQTFWRQRAEARRRLRRRRREQPTWVDLNEAFRHIENLDEAEIQGEINRIAAERVNTLRVQEEARRQRIARQREQRTGLELFALRRGQELIDAWTRERFARHRAWRGD